MKLILPLFLILLLLLLLFVGIKENFNIIKTKLVLKIGKIKNKHIISKETITLKNNKIIIGGKTITKDDINALNSLPVHYESKMCFPDEDGECIDNSDLQNLKKYWNDGTIIAYSGELKNIPPNWSICDGDNGTPDLRDRFIVGAGKKYKSGNTGGKATHKLTIDEIPSHAHTMSFHTSTNKMDTSKPIKVGDIRYGWYGGHAGMDNFMLNITVASKCFKKEYKEGIDYIPGHSLMECVGNITATKKDVFGNIKYRNKLSKRPMKKYDNGTTKSPTGSPLPTVPTIPIVSGLNPIIDMEIYEPVPLYESLYKERNNIKSVGYRFVPGDEVCHNTCLYYNSIETWRPAEVGNLNDSKLLLKAILINDGKENLLKTKNKQGKEIYPELVKSNVKPGSGYFVGPTSNACVECQNSTDTNDSANDSDKGKPHDNMPQYYRVIFLMRNVNRKSETSTQSPISVQPKATQEKDKCYNIIEKIRNTGETPVYLNCD